MWKRLSFALSLLVLLCCSACSADASSATAPSDGTATAPSYGSAAYDATVGGLRLAKREGFVEVVGADPAAAALTIPASYEGLPVTAIASGALAEANALTLSIPASVTEIGQNAFSGALTAIEVDAENPAFASQSGILYKKDFSDFVFTPHVSGEIVIPNGVKLLNKSSGIRYGGREWFDGITSLSLPKSVRAVSGSFLSLCSVEVDVGSDSFVSQSGILYQKETSGLTVALVPRYVSGKITVPSGMTSIPDRFLMTEQGNALVTEVVLPSGVTEIGLDAFRGCTALERINFPSGLRTVKAGAFNGCALTSLSLPASIREIEKDAFDLPRLTSVTIAEGASGISAFAITFREGQYLSLTVSGALLSELGKGHIDGMGDGFDLLYYNFLDMVERLVITSGKTVGANVRQMRALREIVFPSGMTELAEYAFAGCISLRSVKIPWGVTAIGARAFNGCSALAQVSLPDTLRSIGTYAFARTAIVSLMLPASLTSFGSRAFAGIPSIVEVYNLSGVSIGSKSGDAYSLGAMAQFVYTSAAEPSKVTLDASGNLIYQGEKVGYIGSERVLDGDFEQ